MRRCGMRARLRRWSAPGLSSPPPPGDEDFDGTAHTANRLCQPIACRIDLAGLPDRRMTVLAGVALGVIPSGGPLD